MSDSRCVDGRAWRRIHREYALDLFSRCPEPKSLQRNETRLSRSIFGLEGRSGCTQPLSRSVLGGKKRAGKYGNATWGLERSRGYIRKEFRPIFTDGAHELQPRSRGSAGVSSLRRIELRYWCQYSERGRMDGLVGVICMK